MVSHPVVRRSRIRRISWFKCFRFSWLTLCAFALCSSKVCVPWSVVPWSVVSCTFCFQPPNWPVFKNNCPSNPSCLLAKVTIRSFMLPGNMQFSKPVAKLPLESKNNQNQFAIADPGGARESALAAVGGSGRAAATPAPSAGATESVSRATCVPSHAGSRARASVWTAASSAPLWFERPPVVRLPVAITAFGLLARVAPPTSRSIPTRSPPHEPSGRSAAFTPLQLPMVQELFTLKRRERRAPVLGFHARIFSGNSLCDQRRIPLSASAAISGLRFQVSVLFLAALCGPARISRPVTPPPPSRIAQHPIPRSAPCIPHSKSPNEFAKIQPNPT